MTADTGPDLVERLRAIDPWDAPSSTNDLLHEAASTIEHQVAHLAERDAAVVEAAEALRDSKSLLDEAADAVAHLRGEVAERDAAAGAMREALRKAVVHMEWDCPGDTPEPCGLWCDLCRSHVDETPEQAGHAAGCLCAGPAALAPQPGTGAGGVSSELSSGQRQGAAVRLWWIAKHYADQCGISQDEFIRVNGPCPLFAAPTTPPSDDDATPTTTGADAPGQGPAYDCVCGWRGNHSDLSPGATCPDCRTGAGLVCWAPGSPAAGADAPGLERAAAYVESISVDSQSDDGGDPMGIVAFLADLANQIRALAAAPGGGERSNG